MSDFNKEALEIWNSIKPIIDNEIENKTAGTVQRRRAKVTTAPSLIEKVIGVTEPFGNEIFIPFLSNMSSAQVGDYVWVEFMYGATNSFVSMFANPAETSIGQDNYNSLSNKPSINGVELVGNKSTSDLHIDVSSHTYIYEQTQASNTWNISHNLNKYPSITVVDSAGTVVVGDVRYINEYRVVIQFAGAFSGTAYLN